MVNWGLATLFLSLLIGGLSENDVQASDSPPAPIERVEEPFTGDLSEITERRLLRVLVAYSRSNYFLELGTEHGFEFELLSTYGEDLNKGRRLSKKVTVAFVPVPLDKLLSELEAGRGDIAAAGLTITADRQQKVAFTRPYIPKVDEVVVSGPGAPVLETLDDLAGKRVWVRAGSSYSDHLLDLSSILTAKGKPPITVAEAPEYLTTADILELTVLDQHRRAPAGGPHLAHIAMDAVANHHVPVDGLLVEGIVTDLEIDGTVEDEAESVVCA